MKAGELIGILVGVAGLGLGAFYLLQQRNGQLLPYSAGAATGGGGVAQVRASAPPTQTQVAIQNTAGDVATVVQGVGQVASAAASIFDNLSSIFGGG